MQIQCHINKAKLLFHKTSEMRHYDEMWLQISIFNKSPCMFAFLNSSKKKSCLRLLETCEITRYISRENK